MKDGSPPFIEGSVEAVLFPGYSPEELFVYGTVPGIDAPVTDHFEMFFRDMADETFYEFQDRYGLFHIGIIFMAVVMESDVLSVIFINAGSGDDRPTKITTDVFGDDFWIAFIRFGVNIETVFVIFIGGSFNLFERRTEFCFHFIQKGSTESITKESVVKIFHIAPELVITVSPFRDETMDMRVPFKISAEGMKNHDETRSKVLGHVHLEEHAGNDTGDSMEQTVEEFTVFKEEMTEIFVDGENTMPVGNIDQLEGHVGGAFHGILIPAGRAETAVTAEGNEFKLSTFGTAIHGTAIRRVTTMNHLLDIFNHSVARMKSI